MADNFYKTAERALNAAKVLSLSSPDQCHMTCYLAGYVLECTGKEIILKVFQTTSRDVAKEFGHEINELNKLLVLMALDHTLLAHIPAGYWPEFALDAPTILNRTVQVAS